MIGGLLIGGGALALLYAVAKNHAMATRAATVSGTASPPAGGIVGAISSFLQNAEQNLGTVAGGLAHGQVKLGNADPNFETWLQAELDKLFISDAYVIAHHWCDGTAKDIRARRITGYDPQALQRSRTLAAGGPSIGQITGLSVQGAQIGANLVNATGSLAKSIPIVGSVVGIISSIVGVFGAHHAAAVQREQQTL